MLKHFAVRMAGLLPLLLPSTSGRAQSAIATDPKKDEVVTLSPFEVSAAASRGYVTTSSLSASRVAVPIVELPSTVITVNEQFIDDTVAIDMRDTLNFVAGANQGNQGTGTQEQNQVSIRGYTLNTAQRDGVTDRLLTASGGFDYSYIERIEVVKGPSGVLYGSHTPGGIINLISKRPLYKPRTKISTTVGSYNMWRVDLDTSGFFDKKQKFGYRFAGAWSDTDGPLDFVREPAGGLKVYNPSLSYRADNGLYVWAWAAFVDDHIKRLMYTAHAYRTSATTGKVLVSEAERSHGNNIFTSMNGVKSDNYEIGASKTFKMGPVTADVRLLVRSYELNSTGDRVRGVGPTTDLFLDAAGAVLGTDSRSTDYSVAASKLATIAREQIRFDNVFGVEEGEVYTADFNFSFKLGATKNKLLVYTTLDKSDSTSANNQYTINNTAKLVALGAQLVGNQTRIQVWPTPSPAMAAVTPDIVIAKADTRRLNTQVAQNELISFGAIERLSFWKDRIHLVAGVRSDKFDTVSTTIVNNVLGAPSPQDDKSNTSNYAALVKIYEGEKGVASVYFNDNETFIPVFSRDTRLGPTLGQKFENRVAHTSEFGAKLDLFHSRVVGTFSVYDTVENNVLVQFNDQTGAITGIPINTYLAPVGERQTDGWDVDLNFIPAPGWEVMLSYAKTNSYLTDGKRPAAEQPDSNFSGVVRYSFSKGMAKGLSLMWMYSYWGGSILGTRTNWALPGGDIHTAIIGYKWRNWDARLRIENVFDNPAILPSTFETAVGVARPMNFRFGLSYNF